MSSSFHFNNETRAVLPRTAFRAIKEAILGKTYDLCVLIVSPARMKKLNTIYWDKTEPTDILSFPLSRTEGEIYICPQEARKESGKFGRTYGEFMPFLFIHGCVHLKGYDHGSRMEAVEARFRKRFKV